MPKSANAALEGSPILRDEVDQMITLELDNQEVINDAIVGLAHRLNPRRIPIDLVGSRGIVQRL
jgi:hypothetical protein